MYVLVKYIIPNVRRREHSLFTIMATTSEVPATVDEYIAQFEPSVRAILTKVRAAVRTAAPDAVEVISYRMPALKQNGVLVYYAAFKGHIGFYPPIKGDAKLEREASPYSGEKGNLRFPYTEPIPYKLITALTMLRVQQDLARSSTKRLPSRK
jgi:uncharacterized protein YdhG (YjbR/CyaY superfamily)